MTKAEKSRRWRANNHEKALLSGRTWYAVNAAKKYEYHKKWRKDNPDKVRAENARRRALTKGANIIETVNPTVLFNRDLGMCQLCCLPIGDDKWHIDHILPLVFGGEHSYANTQLTHAKCNMSKGTSMLVVG